MGVFGHCSHRWPPPQPTGDGQEGQERSLAETMLKGKAGGAGAAEGGL